MVDSAMPLSFKKNLWDRLEVCLTRLTKGKHDAYTMQMHLLERAKIEDQYSKALLSSCRLAGFETEGTVAACWQNIMSSGSSNAGQHSQFSIMCHEVATELEQIVLFLRQTKQSATDRHDKVLKAKDVSQKAHAKMKAHYHDCISKAEKAITELETAKASGTNASRVPRLTKTATSYTQAVDKANLEYKRSVEALNNVEADYDRTVLQILEELEAAETRRLTLCKAMFQRFTQHHEFLKHAVDQIQTVSFQVLQTADAEADKRTFIASSLSGEDGPGPHTPYELKQSAVIDKQRGYSIEPPTIAAPEIKLADPPPTPTSESSQKGKFGKAPSVSNLLATAVVVPSYSPSPSPVPYPLTTAPAASPTQQQEQKPTGSVAAPSPTARENLTEPNFERGRAGSHVRKISLGGLASVKSGPGSSAYVPVWAVATHNYVSDEPTDLNFSIGQRILLLHFPANEDWWTGDMDGVSGTFPKNRVKVEPGSSSAQLATIQESPMVQEEGYRPMSGTCVAIHEFIGQEEDELTFKINEELVIMGIVDGWYVGRKVGDDRQGIFPCVYVKLTSTLP